MLCYSNVAPILTAIIFDSIHYFTFLWTKRAGNWHNSDVNRSQKFPSLPPLSINKSDSYVFNTEQLVSTPKVAVEFMGERRRRNAPSEFVFRVRESEGHSSRLRVTATRSGGQWFISLVTERGQVLRQYHYQYSPHKNPDGNVVGRSHKHVPSNNNPLREGHKGIDTWAYDPGPYPHDFVEAVKEFCKECNITIQALQERLSLRWFR